MQEETYNSVSLQLVDACSEGLTFEIDRLLQDPRVDPTYDSYRAFRVALYKGCYYAVKKLLEDPRVDPSFSYNYAISTASKYGWIYIVDLLLNDSRVNPADNFNHSIEVASSNGHIHVIERLLEDPRVDPSEGNCAVHALLGNYNLDSTIRLQIFDRLLRDQRVDPNYGNITALFTASYRGYVNIVDRLLLNPRVIVSCENTLLAACTEGYLQVFNRVLADERIDPCVNDNEVFRMALSFGHFNIAERLVHDPRVFDSLVNTSPHLLDQFYSMSSAHMDNIIRHQQLLQYPSHTLVDVDASMELVCGVCQENITANTTVVRLRCGHHYHNVNDFCCEMGNIFTWLNGNGNNRCPMCRVMI
jgi:hypothetical protein